MAYGVQYGGRGSRVAANRLVDRGQGPVNVSDQPDGEIQLLADERVHRPPVAAVRGTFTRRRFHQVGPFGQRFPQIQNGPHLQMPVALEVLYSGPDTQAYWTRREYCVVVQRVFTAPTHLLRN